MSSKHFQLFILLGLMGGLVACKREHVANKIIDGPSIPSSQSVIPAEAAQQFMLLKRDSMGIIVTVVNRLSLTDSTYPELTGPVAQTYSFSLSENHYGTVNIDIQFRDKTNTTIDPIANQTSTATLHSVVITANGNSSLFSYTENLLLTLVTDGDVTGKKNLTGSSSFTGSSYSITFSFPAPGPNTTPEGLTDGSVIATGNGGAPSQPTSMNLIFSTDHHVNGSITWEGLEGGLHFEDNGNGFVVTNQIRILVD